MRGIRALFALVIMMGWLNESGAVTCGRPRSGHPACPMHGPADAGAVINVEAAGHDACHDSGSASHCRPGQQCSMSIEALVPPPRPSNRTA